MEDEPSGGGRSVVNLYRETPVAQDIASQGKNIRPALTLRRATLDDAGILLAHRRAMFAVNCDDTDAIHRTMTDYAPWLWERLSTGEYLGWLVVQRGTNGEIPAASAGLWLIDWPPTPRNLKGKLPYIMSVYTDPAYRRLGLAKQLTTTILDTCREEGYPFAFLHTSAEGRSLYDALGFHPSTEMMIDLTSAASEQTAALDRITSLHAALSA
ncbi:MAG: GNAT family N-acetyltransferase [bacterium]|nr:GNAT family N-acetyltransferase [bacterium]